MHADGTVTFMPVPGFTGTTKRAAYTELDTFEQHAGSYLTIDIYPGPVRGRRPRHDPQEHPGHHRPAGQRHAEQGRHPGAGHDQADRPGDRQARRRVSASPARASTPSTATARSSSPRTLTSPVRRRRWTTPSATPSARPPGPRSPSTSPAQACRTPGSSSARCSSAAPAWSASASCSWCSSAGADPPAASVAEALRPQVPCGLRRRQHRQRLVQRAPGDPVPVVAVQVREYDARRAWAGQSGCIAGSVSRRDHMPLAEVGPLALVQEVRVGQHGDLVRAAARWSRCRRTSATSWLRPVPRRRREEPASRWQFTGLVSGWEAQCPGRRWVGRRGTDEGWSCGRGWLAYVAVVHP